MNRRGLLAGAGAVAAAAVVPTLPVASEQIGYALGSDDGLTWRILDPTIIKHPTQGFYMYMSNNENSEINCWETESDNWMFADWKKIGNLDGR